MQPVRQRAPLTNEYTDLGSNRHDRERTSSNRTLAAPAALQVSAKKNARRRWGRNLRRAILYQEVLPP